MESFDFSVLARETMDLSKELAGQQTHNQNILNGEDSLEELEQSLFDFSLQEEVEIPEGPGLLYHLDKGENTFVVRGIACQNLREAHEDWKSGDSALERKLKAHPEEGKVHFYSFENIELAEVVHDQLVNRRFPIQEDILCNISDPGFSWWLDDGADHFQIFFKSHGIHRADKFVRLGPLGDKDVAGLRWESAVGSIRKLFPVNEFSISEHGIAVSSAGKGNVGFESFKNMLLNGEFSLQRSQFPASNAGLTLYLYFKELAAIRSLWLEVERKVTE